MPLTITLFRNRTCLYEVGIVNTLLAYFVLLLLSFNQTRTFSHHKFTFKAIIFGSSYIAPIHPLHIILPDVRGVFRDLDFGRLIITLFKILTAEKKLVPFYGMYGRVLQLSCTCLHHYFCCSTLLFCHCMGIKIFLTLNHICYFFSVKIRHLLYERLELKIVGPLYNYRL